MDAKQILDGTSCFMVNQIDDKSNENLLTYLKEEGFKHTRWIDLPHLESLYVNVETMCYGHVISGVRTAFTIIDEVPENEFGINEFKTIWNIIKKHKDNNKKPEGNDMKYLSMGSSCFLVKDDELKNPSNEFLTYLENEHFDPLNDITPTGWILVNVKHEEYTNDTSTDEICGYVQENHANSLSIDEFKTIWEIIKEHKTGWDKKKAQKYLSANDAGERYARICHQKDIEKTLDSCYKFKDYEDITEYMEDVIACIEASFSYYTEESARKEVIESMDFIKECYEKKWPAADVAENYIQFI